MIYVGIDDTDVVGSPGTNQLAKALAAHLATDYSCPLVLRHQLLLDRRVPYTSKNSSATLLLCPKHARQPTPALIQQLSEFVAHHAVAGSDPGLCVGELISPAVTAFGRDCQRRVVTPTMARAVARQSGLFLAGLGGSNDGIIGALAAVGLAASGNDGRAVLIDNADDLSGLQPIAKLIERNVVVRCVATGRRVERGRIELGKHLRPNLRNGRMVQFATFKSVSASPVDHWEAVRLP